MPYVTPPSIPESTTCRALLIPDSSDWLAIFGGALTELIYKYNWEQVTGVSVDDAVQVAMQVIAGFYDGCVESGCAQPGGYAVLRVGEDGHVEQLINGEWVEPIAPNAFPPIPTRSEPTSQERRCLAAANAANVLQVGYEALADAFAEGLTTSQAVVRLIEALAIYWFWIAPILNGLVLVLAGLLEFVYQAFYYITADVWDADFTDILRCWLYECASSPTDVVTFDLDCLMEKMVNFNITPPFSESYARLAVQLSYLLNILGGADFLNQAGGTTAITLADCDDCFQSWCYTVDLTSADGGFVSVAGGTWVSGTGWVATNIVLGTLRTILQISVPMDSSVHVTNMQIIYDWFAGNVQPGVTGVLEAYNNFGAAIAIIDMGLCVDGNDQSLAPDTDIMTGASIDVGLQCSHDAYGGSATLTSVTLKGDGAAPTWLLDDGWVEC